ncbi:MAG TPA: hypothetical protein VGL22_06395 [Terracidiphilus sp.]
MVAVLLLCSGWAAIQLRQRILRSRAEALLLDIQRLQVGESSTTQAQSVIARWYQWGPVETECGAGECTSFIRLQHALPAFLTGFSNPTANNLLARMADHLGLRNAAVRAGLRYKGGVVTGKGYSVEVMLPLRDWWTRNAFTPELAVFSDETEEFTETELAHIVPTHPYRTVRRIKSPYGLRINFMPQEPAAQKQQYMDFRLSCLTRFSPCQSESNILPAASELVNQVF